MASADPTTPKTRRARVKIKPGDRFGSLTVLAKASVPNAKTGWWLCRCTCGSERVLRSNFTARTSPDCFCNRICATPKAAVKHSMSKHPAYRSWTGMIQRCHNPNDQAYEYYGARGIRVCENWRSGFVAFWEDMESSWFKGGTVDRVDTNGNYEPGNCVWVPKSQQGKNRRNVPMIETPWGLLTTPELAARIGITPKAMRSRWNSGADLFARRANDGAT